MERFLLEVASLSHYLQGFEHPRWLFGISCINSISYICSTKVLMLWAEQQLGFCQGACRSTFFFSNDIIWLRNFWLYKNFPWKNWKLNITLWIKKEKHHLSKPSSLYFPDVFLGGMLNCWTCWVILNFQQLNFNQKKTDTTSGGATMLWCCDFDVFFFLLARALLWLLPVQSSIPGYDEAMEGFWTG